MSVVSQVLHYTKGDFLRRLVAIALPISLQSIMFSSRGLVDVLMLGQLGEAEIAAVGVAARATFVTTIMLVGVRRAVRYLPRSTGEPPINKGFGKAPH